MKVTKEMIEVLKNQIERNLKTELHIVDKDIFSDDIKFFAKKDLIYKYSMKIRELDKLIERINFGDNLEIASTVRIKEKEEININSCFNKKFQDFIADMEVSYFTSQLEKANNSMTVLSRNTGLDRTYLYRKLQNLGIKNKKEKK